MRNPTSKGRVSHVSFGHWTRKSDTTTIPQIQCYISFTALRSALVALLMLVARGHIDPVDGQTSW